MIPSREYTSNITWTVTPGASSVSVPLTVGGGTVGGEQAPRFLPITPSSNSVADAWRVVTTMPNRDVANAAARVLLNVETSLRILDGMGVARESMPPLQAFLPNSDSILLEWSTRNLRAGIAVEATNQPEWYYASDRSLGHVAASGTVSALDPSVLVPFMLDFVVDNS